MRRHSPATHPHTATTSATTEALADERGVLPAGSARTGAVRRQAPASRTFGEVRITREGIGPWRCDTCPVRGTGWLQVESHLRATGHRRYTSTTWPGIATPRSRGTTRR